jgi:chromosome segregation ATPase
MSDEIGQTLTELHETVVSGFARLDRYFELQQAQFLDFRSHVIGEFTEIRSEMTEFRSELASIRGRIDALTARVDRLEHEIRSLRGEFSSFRDWVTREFADVRSELRELRRVTSQSEIEQLSARVERLEQRWDQHS